MNKEEQIALELVKVVVNNTPDSIKILDKGIIDMYKSFVNELRDLKEEENEKNKLYDAIDTYRYIVEGIKFQIEKDDNNFVYKEELKKLIGGAMNE